MGIQMRPFLQFWQAYPVYAAVGASFGYYLQGVEDNQMRYLRETRDRLLEKRRRRAEREAASGADPTIYSVGNVGTSYQRDQEGLLASPKIVVSKDALGEVPAGTVERTAAAE
jgi:hypothetical protein